MLGLGKVNTGVVVVVVVVVVVIGSVVDCTLERA